MSEIKLLVNKTNYGFIIDRAYVDFALQDFGPSPQHRELGVVPFTKEAENMGVMKPKRLGELVLGEFALIKLRFE